MKRVLFVATAINTAFAAFLTSWVTDDDIEGLPSDPARRFMRLWYFSVASFTGTGCGDDTVRVVSDRVRFVISVYILTIFSVVIHRLSFNKA
jgi:hypothetical protein